MKTKASRPKSRVLTGRIYGPKRAKAVAAADDAVHRAAAAPWAKSGDPFLFVLGQLEQGK